MKAKIRGSRKNKRGTFCRLGISFEAPERGLLWRLGNGGGQKRWWFTAACLGGDMAAWLQVRGGPW